jgi:hypothetical protein
MANLTVQQANAIFRNPKRWPGRTGVWGVANRGEYWIRCRPSGDPADRRPQPVLVLAGSELFSTEPDGMWGYFRGIQCVDVIVFEICGTTQNFYDKRARYLSTGASLVMRIPGRWFNGTMRLQNGGSATRQRSAGTFGSTALSQSNPFYIPVRALRAVFVFPDDKYKDWKDNMAPAGHEFFMRHSSFESGNSPKTQEFLKRMSFTCHFLTQK